MQNSINERYKKKYLDLKIKIDGSGEMKIKKNRNSWSGIAECNQRDENWEKEFCEFKNRIPIQNFVIDQHQNILEAIFKNNVYLWDIRNITMSDDKLTFYPKNIVINFDTIKNLTMKNLYSDDMSLHVIQFFNAIYELLESGKSIVDIIKTMKKDKGDWANFNVTNPIDIITTFIFIFIIMYNLESIKKTYIHNKIMNEIINIGINDDFKQGFDNCNKMYMASRREKCKENLLNKNASNLQKSPGNRNLLKK